MIVIIDIIIITNIKQPKAIPDFAKKAPFKFESFFIFRRLIRPKIIAGIAEKIVPPPNEIRPQTRDKIAKVEIRFGDVIRYENSG